MATRSLNLIADIASRKLLASLGSKQSAATPSFVQGDNIAVEFHAVTLSDSFSTPTPETAIPASAVVILALGTPGSQPIAQAVLSTALQNNLGRSGLLSLNTAEVEAFLAGAASKSATLEIEMTEVDGTVTTLAQVACAVINDLIAVGGTPPAAVPALASQVAANSAAIASIQGGILISPTWANLGSAPFATCTLTGGIPTTLATSNTQGSAAFVELAIPTWGVATLDLTGALIAGTATNCTQFLTFLGAGGEVLPAGGRIALTLGASFSHLAVAVPVGATKVAFGVETSNGGLPHSFASGFSSLAVVARANITTLTADALAAILADKAQAQSDAATVAALVSPAQSDAAAADQARIDAQADAAAANAAYGAIVGVPLRVDDEQPLTSAQQRQGRENLGVGTSGGGAYAAGTHTPATAIAVSDFEMQAEVTPGITGTLLTIVHGGGTYSLAANDARFGAARWRGISYVASTGVLTAYADGAAHATTTALTAGAVSITKVGDALVGTVVRRKFTNRALTTDERSAVMRGETPAGLARPGFTPNTGANLIISPNDIAGALSGQSSTGVTFTQTGGAGGNTTFLVVNMGASALKQGQRFTASMNLISSGYSSVSVSAAAFDAGGYVGEVPVASVGTAHSVDYTALADLRAASSGFVWFRIFGIAADASSSHVVSAYTDNAIGTVADFRPENVTSLGRWIDASANAYDLIPGAGVTPLNPSASLSRVVKATVSGATVTAGTVASIGTLTGATAADTAALAAVRQWDAVSASWGQARPANAAALVPTATANGAVTLETSAHTSNATVSAGTSVRLVHHIA